MADQPDAKKPDVPRQTRRRSIHGVLVAIDAPEIADQPWVADAMDINAGGMGLVLPPELPEGTPVTLSFRLGEGLDFSQLPAVIRHRDGVSGGVRFGEWPEADRLKLLEYLVRCYEAEG